MSRLQANLLLLLAAALWGFGNVAQKTVLEDIGPFTTIGFRGGIGLGVVTPLAVRELFRGDLRRHLLLFLRPSLTFCAALAMQQIAYGGTTVTNASFLVNTTVLFTPAVAWLMIRERPNPAGIFGAILAIAGVGLMAGTLDGIAWGDAACLVSALLYSIWIVQVAEAMRQADMPFLLAACQFAAAALLGLLLSLGWEKTTLSALQGAIPELTILGVFSTGVAFALQAKAQRWTPPTDAAVLMAAESLFGALAAASLLDERLTPTRSLGAAMIIGAVVSVQWRDSTRVQTIFVIAYNLVALLGRVLASMAEAIHFALRFYEKNSSAFSPPRLMHEHGGSPIMLSISAAKSQDDFEEAKKLCTKLAQWDASVVPPKYGISPSDLLEVFYNESQASLAEKFRSTDAKFLIARWGPLPVGSLGFNAFDQHCVELQHFYVDAQFRGRTIGRILMEAALAEIAKGPRRRVLIHTTPYMTHAVAIYEAFGFRPCARFRDTPERIRPTDVFMDRHI